MTYIDTEKLIAEIERQSKSIENATGDFAEGRRWELDNLHKLITSLQQEQPEAGLGREEISRFIRPYFNKPDYDGDFIAEVDWEKSMEECARHFWNKGYNARKEE